VERQSPRQPKKVVRLDVPLDTADAKAMRPGMRVRGAIETGRVPGVLLAPLSAVFRSSDGAVVFKKGWGGFSMTPVTLGRRNATEVEITKGVSDGDKLWTGGAVPGKKAA
jgi:multidrug efflux pump subunit AcrA (membrane-fusion protein)